MTEHRPVVLDFQAMREPIDVREALHGQQLHEADFISSAYWFERRVPAHGFTTLIATLDDQSFVVLVARDYFDPNLAGAIVNFMRNQPAPAGLSKPVNLLHGFHQPGYSFDEMLLLGPGANGLFQNQPELASRCLPAIPVFHGEFSGSETPEVVDLVRRQNVKTLEWRRDASPQVWIHVSDARLGRKRGLTDRAHALGELERLAAGAEVRIENYRGDVAGARRAGDGFLIRSGAPAEDIAVPAARIGEWLDGFLTVRARPRPGHASPLPPLAGSPPLEVFLSDYQRDRHIRSEEPVTMSLERALDEFDRLPDVDGCFIGFRRPDGAMLQFIWNEDGSLQADSPIPARR